MKDAAFFDLTHRLTQFLRGDEVLLCNLDGEASDFVRLNGNRVRQAGGLRAWRLSLDLIEGRRQAQASCDLSGDLDEDLARARGLMARLEPAPGEPQDPGHGPVADGAADSRERCLTLSFKADEALLAFAADEESAQGQQDAPAPADGRVQVGCWWCTLKTGTHYLQFSSTPATAATGPTSSHVRGWSPSVWAWSITAAVPGS